MADHDDTDEPRHPPAGMPEPDDWASWLVTRREAYVMGYEARLAEEQQEPLRAVMDAASYRIWPGGGGIFAQFTVTRVPSAHGKDDWVRVRMTPAIAAQAGAALIFEAAARTQDQHRSFSAEGHDHIG